VIHTLNTSAKSTLEKIAAWRLPALNLPELITLCAIASTSLLLGWLGYNSWQFFHSLDQPAPQMRAVPVPEALPVPTLEPEKIARLFGVSPPTKATPTTTHLLLLASLVGAESNLSRALIQSPAGSQFYSIGQTLPGGGRLQSIQTDQVMIELLGEPHPLLLQPRSASLLAPFVPPGAVEVARTVPPPSH
jgi:type II secretory pathway component PulC